MAYMFKLELMVRSERIDSGSLDPDIPDYFRSNSDWLLVNWTLVAPCTVKDTKIDRETE